jgi:Fe-S cluster assembly protein SufD
MTTFTEQFAEAAGRLPGSPTTAAERAAAFDGFERLGLPHRKQENWRYTDLQGIRDANYDLLAATAIDEVFDTASAVIERTALPCDGPRAVFIDGQYSDQLSSLGAEYPIASLADSWDSLAQLVPLSSGVAEHPLALLNAAFARHGLVIHVPPGVRAEEPLTVVFVGAGTTPIAAQPRIAIQLEADSELSVNYHFIDAKPVGSWTNVVTQIHQASNSQLCLHRLQEHGDQQFHTSLTYARLAANARLVAGFVDIGSRLTRNDIDVKLAERGASFNAFGTFLAAGGQHKDNHIRVDHLAADTRSTETFRGIVGARSRGVFNGKVVVHQDAQGVDASQRSDNLLLDETAEIDTKPELEIYADDVKCSHGATVGELDEQHLYYLRSRGIGDDAARALLTFAFANSILREIADPQLREAITDRVAASLPQGKTREQLA